MKPSKRTSSRINFKRLFAGAFFFVRSCRPVLSSTAFFPALVWLVFHSVLYVRHGSNMLFYSFFYFLFFLFFVFGVWVFTIYRSIPTVFGHRGSRTTNLNLSHLIKCNNILSSTDWIWRRRRKKQTTVMFLVMVWFVTNLDRLILKFIDSARFKIRGISFYRLLALFFICYFFQYFQHWLWSEWFSVQC